MRILLPLQIAIRFSQGRRRGRMISLSAVLSTISIALGVSVLIISLSIMNGFEYELNNRILAVIPHGEIESVNPPFANWPGVLKHIEQMPGILAAAPYLNFTSLAERGDKLQVIQIRGVDPILELRLSALPRYIKGNVWSHFQAGHHQIILGKGVADMLKIKPGDWLTIIIPNTDSQMKLLESKRIRLQVSGIMSLNSQLDHSFAMLPLVDAQNYLKFGENIMGIAIKVSDVFNANKLVQNAGKIINAHVKIRSWIDTYGYVYHDIQMIRAIIYLAVMLVISVACFNIISTLIMAVKDKSSDLALLQTHGAKDRLISAIFIWYGLLAGLTGSAIGTMIGVLITINMTTLIKSVERLLGHNLLSGNIYFIDFLPTELHLMDTIRILAMTLLLSILASWYPAKQASCINPARILSYQ